MAVLEGLEVSVENSETHQVYAELDDDCTIRQSSVRRSTQYIEVLSQQKFALVLQTLPTFDWHGADGLSVLIDFDEGAIINQYEVVLSKHGMPDTNVPAMTLKQTRDHHEQYRYTIDSATLGDMHEGYLSCRRYHFIFRELHEDDESGMRARKTLEHQGEVRVVVKRVTIQARKQFSRPSFGSPRKVARASKTTLEAKNLHLEIGVIDAGPVVCQPEINFTTREAQLSHPQVGTYVFRYRPKGVLGEDASDSDISVNTISPIRKKKKPRLADRQSSVRCPIEVRSDIMARCTQAKEEVGARQLTWSSTETLIMPTTSLDHSADLGRAINRISMDVEDSIVSTPTGTVLVNHSTETTPGPESDRDEEFKRILVEIRGIKDRLNQARRNTERDSQEYEAKKGELLDRLDQEKDLQEQRRIRSSEESAALELELMAVRRRTEQERTKMEKAIEEQRREVAYLKHMSRIGLESYRREAEALQIKLAEERRKREDRRKRIEEALAGTPLPQKRAATDVEEGYDCGATGIVRVRRV